MKQILIPTDFSACADNAIYYALKFANAVSASLTLFHVYHIPVLANDLQNDAESTMKELENDSMNKLRQLKSTMGLLVPEVKVNIQVCLGSATDEIKRYGTESSYDLIIMGINGEGNVPKWLGNTATSVASNVPLPVLLVPAEVKFRELNHVIFAFDFINIKHPERLFVVSELSRILKFRMSILNIVDEVKNDGLMERALARIQLNELLSGTDYKFSLTTDKEVIHGISGFVKENHGDLLVMIKRQYGFIERIFKGSHTNKMAFHTDVPLLILHD